MKTHKTRNELLNEFDQAPDNTLFEQTTIAAVRSCSTATLERDRWLGGGIPFVKIGRSVRYHKNAVLSWLEQHKTINSTSAAQG